MRFCVSCRQPKKVRDKADELKVEWRDIIFIDNYIENPENHIIILEVPSGLTKDWAKLKMYSDKLNNKLILALKDVGEAYFAQEYGIKFYWDYPVCSYYELNYLDNLGAEQVILGIPLIFDIENIKLPIRLCPDAKMNEYLYDADDAIAAWIRPEGLSKYEPYAVSCEFKERDLTRQSALLDVYKQGYWKDELNFVINSLSMPVYNQYIPEGFDKNRLNCKQICQRRLGSCRSCQRNIEYAKKIKELNENGSKRNDS